MAFTFSRRPRRPLESKGLDGIQKEIPWEPNWFGRAKAQEHWLGGRPKAALACSLLILAAPAFTKCTVPSKHFIKRSLPAAIRQTIFVFGFALASLWGGH